MRNPLVIIVRRFLALLRVCRRRGPSVHDPGFIRFCRRPQFFVEWQYSFTDAAIHRVNKSTIEMPVGNVRDGFDPYRVNVWSVNHYLIAHGFSQNAIGGPTRDVWSRVRRELPTWIYRRQ